MYKSKGLKYISIQKVKDYFIKYKYATKNDIADSTKLSHATITNILKELLDNHYIEQVEDCESTGGRKAKRYKICGAYMFFGLIDLHVEKHIIHVMCRVIDLDFRIIKNVQYCYKQLSKEKLIHIIQKLKDDHFLEHISLSIPAIVNNGKIEKCDIDSLENIDLKEYIESKCDIQVAIENDVNTAMLGYIHTHEIKSSSVAFVYQPDHHHSGCGLYINHAILYGATHFAGELGYLPNGTLIEQEETLKNNPLSLLVKQVTSIIAIVNPSLIILHAPCINDAEFIHMIEVNLPHQHLPQFQFIESMEKNIFDGLACLCIENSRYKGIGE
ncbi:ROK family protein [Candidatus Stoquefichus massiliensis]|uniref:ROK family protein n=1 Tax=Candidatus Stoquefichus massiliensis TaxID=1470350 RepID=UPI000480E372|nr:ROK family protein [Candidatus Stoquefichus massiliensis]